MNMLLSLFFCFFQCSKIVPCIQQQAPGAFPELLQKKNALRFLSRRLIQVGDYLFSQAVSSELSSAQVSLTSVFGMGTGGTLPSSTPTDLTGLVYHNWSTLSSIFQKDVPSKLNNHCSHFFVDLKVSSELWSSPRPISTRLLNGSLHLHIVPINLVVFKGSYLFETMGYLIFGSASRLDAFSVYPIRT